MGRRVLMANMQMERLRFGDCCNNHELGRCLLMESTPPTKSYSNNTSPAASGGGRWSVGGSGGGGLDYIEHTVSKFDTLVGVAIKYGVEVVDIKRMNGLIVDQQMFALKSLKIPVRGRHPPSPLISNGSTKEVIPNGDRHSNLFGSIKSLKLSSSSCQSKGSPCLNNLQYHYGCKLKDENGITQSFEMALYRKGSTHDSEKEDKTYQTSNPFVEVYRKSKILINGVSVTNDKNNGFDKYFEKLVRRRNGKNTTN